MGLEDPKALGSEGDRRSNELIMDALLEARPDDAVLSEEGDDRVDRPDRAGASRVWVVDPLDGTREVSEGRDDFAVHVGLAVDGLPMVGAVALPGEDLVLVTGARRSRARSLAPRPDGPLRIVVSRTRPPAEANRVAARLGVPSAHALQFVQRLHGDQRAGCANRMAKRDARTVRIDLRGIQRQFLRYRASLRRERFVGFDHVEVANAQSRALQRLSRGRNRTNAHVLRIDARVRIRNQPRERLQATLFSCTALHQHDGRGRIVDTRRIAGGHRPVFLGKHGLEFRKILERRVQANVLVGIEDNVALLRCLRDGKNLFLEITRFNSPAARRCDSARVRPASRAKCRIWRRRFPP